MAPKESTFASGLGVQLYTEACTPLAPPLCPSSATHPPPLPPQHWETESPPTASLLFVHGIGDHVGRYRPGAPPLRAPGAVCRRSRPLPPVFHKLAGRGIAVHAFDSLGHGKSGAHPSRGRHNVETLDELVEDVHSFSAHVAASYAPGAAPPLFLCGQSLGCAKKQPPAQLLCAPAADAAPAFPPPRRGLVAALACLREPTRYRGLVLVAPAMDVEWTTTLHVMAAFGGVLAACLPNAALVPAVQTKFLSRDPAVVEAHDKDDLVPKGDAKVRRVAFLALLLVAGWMGCCLTRWNLTFSLFRSAASPTRRSKASAA